MSNNSDIMIFRKVQHLYLLEFCMYYYVPINIVAVNRYLETENS